MLDRIPFSIVILVSGMGSFDKGSRVRIDIPDESDADHELHGEHGTVIEVIRDDASDVTGRDQDDDLYRIDLDSVERTVDVRARDIRPPIED